MQFIRMPCLSRRVAAPLLLVLFWSGPAASQADCDGQVSVDHGQTLASIARDCGIPLSALLRANPDIANPDLVTPGTRLAMPDVEMVRAEVRGYVESRAGETLADVARRHEMPLALLIAHNPGVETGELDAGTRIVLPQTE